MLYKSIVHEYMISHKLCTRYEQNNNSILFSYIRRDQLTLANVCQDFLTETLQHKVQAFLEETFHDSMPFDRDHLDIAAIVAIAMC